MGRRQSYQAAFAAVASVSMIGLIAVLVAYDAHVFFDFGRVGGGGSAGWVGGAVPRYFLARATGGPGDGAGGAAGRRDAAAREIGPVVFPDAPATPDSSDSLVSFNYVLLLCTMLACYLMAYALRVAEFRYLHESGAAILIGMLVGGVIRFLGELERLQSVVAFNSTLFFLFLLPPIIFEAGYGLSRSTFFHNFYSIMMYAFGGTLIVSFSFGLMVWLFCLTPLVREQASLSLIECLLFGAMVSATDPVTTLAIFSDLRVPKVLYANVFGESVFNDAVAIVLYRTISIFRDEPVAGSTFAIAVIQFTVIFVGSIVVGIVFGLGVAIMFRLTEFRRYPNFEVSVLLIAAYTSYLVAEGLGLSGIVAILFAGIVMAQYATLSMSHEANHGSEFVFRILASTSEMFVFVYIGLSVFSLRDQLYDFGLIAVSLVALFFTRILNVVPLTALLNSYRRVFKPVGHEPISGSILFIMYWAGLRGAIAFSLSLDIDTPGGDYIRSTTLFLVLATIVLIGGTTYPLLVYLKVPLGEPWTADEPIPEFWQRINQIFMRRMQRSDMEMGEIHKSAAFSASDAEDSDLGTDLGAAESDNPEGPTTADMYDLQRESSQQHKSNTPVYGDSE